MCMCFIMELDNITVYYLLITLLLYIITSSLLIAYTVKSE